MSNVDRPGCGQPQLKFDDGVKPFPVSLKIFARDPWLFSARIFVLKSHAAMMLSTAFGDCVDVYAPKILIAHSVGLKRSTTEFLFQIVKNFSAVDDSTAL